MPHASEARAARAIIRSDRKRGVDDALRLGHDVSQVRRAAKALRVDLVDVLRSRGSCREPAAPRHDLETADRLIVRRARASASLRSARRQGWSRATSSGDSFCESRLLFGRRWSVDSRVVRSAEAPFQFLVVLPGSSPVRAVISAASRPMIKPSLSVVQTAPSFRRKLAPALSSPPKHKLPSNKPGANHLKPDRHLRQPPPGSIDDAIDHAAADHGLADGDRRRPQGAIAPPGIRSRRQESGSGSSARPTASRCRVCQHPGRCRAPPDTRSRSATRLAIAYGLEQSMRIRAVVVERHEAERGVDPSVHDGEVQPVALGYRLPVRE